MYAWYEEDGDIKAGTILTDNDSSVQMESQHGKRTKVKAAHILLKFSGPGPSEAMETAKRLAAEIDADFLWEVAGSEEFGFADIASDYYGKTPTGPEAGAVLLTLHGAPIYFYKKGKGRYKAAPADALAAAKAGLARKAREAELRAEWADALKSGGLPDPFRAKVFELAHKPDKNSLEYKALMDACAETGLSPVRLLDKCGAIPSSHEFHRQAFLLEHFPKGTGFPDLAPLSPPPELPMGDAPAFSIDDAATTEIDDAFSVIFRPDGSVRVGIHIAAPALGILPGSELDHLAASRLSTVYMPGDKITMLPEGLVNQYTLAENRDCAALSLYVEVGPDYTIKQLDTQADVIRIAANLRHETLEPLFNEGTIRNPDAPDYAFRKELEWLWGFACQLEAARGKVQNAVSVQANYGAADVQALVAGWSQQVQRLDYNFKVVDDRVSILPRVRGNPIDKLVSELMILANSRWGQLLADHDYAGMYRAQTQGKVRMTLKPAPHEGLGLACYAWSTSPLRRYVDLVNQRQILAAAQGEKAVYAGNDPMLFAALRDFELAHDAYNDFQCQMERYWCLRWLMQEGIGEMEATVLKENLVRFVGLPLVTRVTGAPALTPGDMVRVAVADFDLLDNELTCRYLATSSAA
jgi:exoribonuclease II